MSRFFRPFPERTRVARATGSPPVAGGGVTINGIGFGTKSTAAPVYFTDFSSDSDGTEDTSLGWDASYAPDVVTRPAVASDQLYGGKKAMKCIYPAFDGGHFPVSTLFLPTPSTKLRFACYFRWAQTVQASQQLTTVFKLARAGNGTPYTGVPRFYHTINPSLQNGNADGAWGENLGGDCGFVNANGTTNIANDAFSDTNPGSAADLVWDAWHRIEWIYELSTAGSADGKFVVSVNGLEPNSPLGAVMTRAAGDSGKLIEWVISVFDGMDSYGVTNEFAAWMALPYIDSSFARVVGTDSSTYSSSTKWADQPCTSWSDTQIVISSPNYAGFSSGSTIYMHVFDDSNTHVGSYSRTVP